MNNPVIVIAAYNRPEPLARLLKSISKAEYPGKDIRLIISIDNSKQQASVFNVASKFHWLYGEKEIIAHDNHLGLRAHILACGDLSQTHGEIILLEDDLYVSPYFYTYAIRACRFYTDDARIAGISLYAHSYNETAMLTFIAYADGFSNYFLQLASSWGQAWSAQQWVAFRRWHDEHQSTVADDIDILPKDVGKWPESSWKKHFIRYMVRNDKYFVYPRVSLTTNFMDPGTHHKAVLAHLQVPLQNGLTKYKFSSMENSAAIYDAYCEPAREVLIKLCTSLANFQHNFIVDLYGTKMLKPNSKDYVLTSQECQVPILKWGRRLKPHESNLYSEIHGSDFSLGEMKDCKKQTKQNYFFIANYYNSLSKLYYRKITTEYESQLKKQTADLAMSEKKLNAIRRSTIWRSTYPLRKMLKFVQKIVNH